MVLLGMPPGLLEGIWAVLTSSARSVQLLVAYKCKTPTKPPPPQKKKKKAEQTPGGRQGQGLVLFPKTRSIRAARSVLGRFHPSPGRRRPPPGWRSWCWARDCRTSRSEARDLTLGLGIKQTSFSSSLKIFPNRKKKKNHVSQQQPWGDENCHGRCPTTHFRVDGPP